MKKIDPNVASRMIEKETGAHELWDKFETIGDDLEILKSYVKVLDYCLAGIGEVTGFEYSEIYQFVEEFKKKMEETREKFDELHHDLMKSGHLGSQLDLNKGVFLKSKTTIQEIPTTWKSKKSDKPKKKAA